MLRIGGLNFLCRIDGVRAVQRFCRRRRLRAPRGPPDLIKSFELKRPKQNEDSSIEHHEARPQ